jgi:ATP-dependent Clp protease protease subunit
MNFHLDWTPSMHARPLSADAGESPTPPAVASRGATELEARAFRSRTLAVFGEITDALAADTVRRLLAMDAESDAPIQMWVSSPGGHLESGDAIHDVVRFIASPVTMIGTGWVGSAATHLFLAAQRSRRFCTPQTRFLIHQPSGGAGGPATDISIQAREILRARERIAHTISSETGQPLDQVLRDIERDRWLSAQEAVEYGLVSRIVARRSEAGF